MKRTLKALFAGAIFFCITFILGFAFGSLTLLLKGLEFMPWIIVRVCAKGALGAGITITLIFLLGEPRSLWMLRGGPNPTMSLTRRAFFGDMREPIQVNLASTYRPRVYQRQFPDRLGAAVMACFGVVMLGSDLINHTTIGSSYIDTRWWWIEAVVILGLCIFGAGPVWWKRLVLSSKGVELHGLTGSQLISLEDITGTCFKRSVYKWTLLIVPRSGRTIRINYGLDIDLFFKSWIASLPNLDGLNGRG